MKYLIKRLFIYLILMICVANLHAQMSLIQKAINNIEDKNSISYQSIDIDKNPGVEDTTIRQRESTFLKSPNDSIYGYLFKIKEKQLVGLYKEQTFVNLYKGQNIIGLILNDSTYRMWKPNIHDYNFRTSLLGHLKLINEILNNSPSKIKQASDTTINSIVCHHFIFNLYDSIVDNKRMYHNEHLFIANSSALPICIVFEGISKLSEGTYLIDYNKRIYSDYVFNQNNINDVSATIPNGFHPVKERSSLLPLGTSAPNWTLYSTSGKKLSLSELKGKVVLLDFSFIGCTNCMEALIPMNSLHDKYKNKDVVIASIFFRDKNEVVKKFVRNYNIKYPVYVDADSKVAESYHVPGGPYFYFIDKYGKIENVISGYYRDVFEEKTSSIIDSLINK